MALRVLIVGTGSIGLRHARLMSECPNLKVEVCDTRPEGLAEAAALLPHCSQWINFEHALQTPLEVAMIATPPQSHARLACAALRSGADVFCEKPLASSLEEAREIAKEQEESGRLVNVGFAQRFMPELLRLRKLVQEGTLGTICHVSYSVSTLATLECSRSRHQREVFGAAALDYIYGFDTFWWVLGRQPTQVYARGIQAPGMLLLSTPNVISSIAEYPERLLAEIHIDYVAHPQRSFLTFQGDLGYFHVDLIRQTVQHGDRRSGEIKEEKFSYPADDLFRWQRDHFLGAVQGKQAVSTSALDALPGQAATDALIRSLRSGKAEKVLTTGPVGREGESPRSLA
jgi:predicted dehydrogenase